MTNLSTQIEQATAPSRALDLEIMRWAENIGGHADNALHYTSSIDAALTLSGPDPLSLLMASIFFCQQDGGTVEDLPRYICAAALKARNPTT